MKTPHLLSTREDLLPHLCQVLGRAPLDFTQRWRLIREENRAGGNHLAAGVLLLIHERQPGEMVFQLIKRSGRVSQGGDVSCPGGMLAPGVDGRLARLTCHGFIPAFFGPAAHFARQRPDRAWEIINLFLANAIRESWEEVHLHPYNVACLGALPTYGLTLFRRTIFPLVAFVKDPWSFQPNSEVDKVIEIPLLHFYDSRHYAWFTVEKDAPGTPSADRPSHFPCFVHQDGPKTPDILWGATFFIILNFLTLAFAFQMPPIPAERVFSRVLSADYLTGRSS